MSASPSFVISRIALGLNTSGEYGSETGHQLHIKDMIVLMYNQHTFLTKYMGRHSAAIQLVPHWATPSGAYVMLTTIYSSPELEIHGELP